MNDFRPDWIGAIGAGIAAFISLPIANRFVPRTRNQTMFYVVFGICLPQPVSFRQRRRPR